MFFILANLEELQSVEARQCSNLETQLEEMKDKCQDKQDTVEEIRYVFGFDFKVMSFQSVVCLFPRVILN